MSRFFNVDSLPLLVDTHCHLNMMVKKEFDTLLTITEQNIVSSLVKEADMHGVSVLINVGTSVIENENCLFIAKNNNTVWTTLGIHPNDLSITWRDDIAHMQSLLKNKEQNKIVGIGEIGLDFHYPNYNKKQQEEAFEMQIEYALHYNLPLVIHTRDAQDQVLTLLASYKNKSLRGIIHCFSEDLSFAYKALDLGFVLGFGGTITYPKNESLRSVAIKVPLESIVLETDAPFLPPQELRGKQNHPQNIKLIATFLATLRSCSFEKVAQTTTKTALSLFGLLQS